MLIHEFDHLVAILSELLDLEKLRALLRVLTI